jgi:lipopolysaccharide transport system ATP-binding protein
MSGRRVIEVEDVHKRYELGVIGASQLSDELKALWASLRGRPDPRMDVEAAAHGQRAGNSFWSLRGVTFALDQGDILGVIGRNGAGKSTLLKLLSRISLPTKGRIAMRGKVSSLLEVGTGFHPELTGMENIYLNGAILGMRRAEIDRKRDEIIAFSGIDHHIHTPIKRYSSGMKVRLGFAVAAHLEPEILIVDEVLAVGDAEFQRKCLGSMRNVADQGRTILFVSHSMNAVQGLCTKALWLEKGKVRMQGGTDEVVSAYVMEHAAQVLDRSWAGQDAPGDELLSVRSVSVRSMREDGLMRISDPIRVEIEVENAAVTDNDIGIRLSLRTGTDAVAFISDLSEAVGERVWPLGRSKVVCTIPGGLLNTGTYRINLMFIRKSKHWFRIPEAVIFETQEGPRKGTWIGDWGGAVRPTVEWSR